MADESLNRAETIVDYFGGYGIVINKADYNDLGQLAQKGGEYYSNISKPT